MNEISPRPEAPLVFGPELEEAVEHVPQGLLISGPLKSGKTILGIATSTLCAATRDIIYTRSQSDPKFPNFGNESLEGLSDEGIQEEVAYEVERRLRDILLPPAVVIDEIKPFWVTGLPVYCKEIEKYYIDRGEKPPAFIFIVQSGTEADKGEDSILDLIGNLRKLPDSKALSLVEDAYRMTLAVKEHLTGDFNNAAFSVVAKQAPLLREKIGSDRYDGLVQSLRTSMLKQEK